MVLVEQFKNLLDPSTVLGAYLISMSSSIIVSFFAGVQYQKNIKKKNFIKVNNVNGGIEQDVRRSSDAISSKQKLRKENIINAGTIRGIIRQDVEK